jgi:hypothetical protein
MNWPTTGAVAMKLVDVRVGNMADCAGLYEPHDRVAAKQVRDRLRDLHLVHARVVVTDVLVTRPGVPWRA